MAAADILEPAVAAGPQEAVALGPEQQQGMRQALATTTAYESYTSTLQKSLRMQPRAGLNP